MDEKDLQTFISTFQLETTFTSHNNSTQQCRLPISMQKWRHTLWRFGKLFKKAQQQYRWNTREERKIPKEDFFAQLLQEALLSIEPVEASDNSCEPHKPPRALRHTSIPLPQPGRHPVQGRSN